MTTTTTIRVYREAGANDWVADDGIAGSDGYRSRIAAEYAARVRAWGEPYPTPDEADRAIAKGWTE